MMSLPRFEYGKKCMSLIMLVGYLSGFFVAGLFHPAEHAFHQDELIDNQLVDHCYHLHNALNFEDECEQGAHISSEHKHCEFCDVFLSKKEIADKSYHSGIRLAHVQQTKNSIQSVWQSIHFSKVYLRGPPRLV